MCVLVLFLTCNLCYEREGEACQRDREPAVPVVSYGSGQTVQTSPLSRGLEIRKHLRCGKVELLSKLNPHGTLSTGVARPPDNREPAEQVLVTSEALPSLVELIKSGFVLRHKSRMSRVGSLYVCRAPSYRLSDGVPPSSSSTLVPTPIPWAANHP